MSTSINETVRDRFARFMNQPVPTPTDTMADVVEANLAAIRAEAEAMPAGHVVHLSVGGERPFVGHMPIEALVKFYKGRSRAMVDRIRAPLAPGHVRVHALGVVDVCGLLDVAVAS